MEDAAKFMPQCWYREGLRGVRTGGKNRGCRQGFGQAGRWIFQQEIELNGIKDAVDTGNRFLNRKP
jgi:hypothetical protein